LRSTTAGRKLLSLKEANARISSIAANDLAPHKFRTAQGGRARRNARRLLIALANLDEFLRIIRGSANRDEARVKLLAFEFTNAR